MRWRWSLIAAAVWLGASTPSGAATGRVLKVLPEFLDTKGRTSLAPSLYERDAYQAVLRLHPEKRAGMRFFIQWKLKGPAYQSIKLRLELRGGVRGSSPKQLVLEEPLLARGGWFSHWSTLALPSDKEKEFGAVSAWRVTLWEGAQMLGEQRSFLW